MQFIDTNVFIRYITKDDPDKAEACFGLFKRIETSETMATTSESVIAEVAFVLSSPRLYNLSHEEIRETLYPLLTLPGLRLQQRDTYLRALDLYALHPLDFEDVLSVAHMEHQHIEEVVSYDKGFNRLAHISRVEP